MNLQTETYKSFENDKFNLFEVEAILTNDNFDPDSNFFNDKINSVESTYYTHEEFVSFSGQVDSTEFAESAESAENHNFLSLLIKQPKNYP